MICLCCIFQPPVVFGTFKKTYKPIQRSKGKRIFSTLEVFIWDGSFEDGWLCKTDKVGEWICITHLVELEPGLLNVILVIPIGVIIKHLFVRYFHIILKLRMDPWPYLIASTREVRLDRLCYYRHEAMETSYIRYGYWSFHFQMI